ncbi:cutinase [Pseudofrankia sp. BMG5.36]|nr:cutinase [Pseudofrankia sp. BMG5.36]
MSGCPGPDSGPPTPVKCADVEVVFARGSGELPGLGITGGPFVSSLKADLAGKSVNSYAVNYAADVAQTSAGSGATDMTNHVTSVAAECPNTKFVLGGYSQGASVTDIAIGIPTLLGSGKTIPTNLAPRVWAVVVFGNPLALLGQHIPTASKLYGSKAQEFCALGDPVCGNGVNGVAHLTYGSNGMTTQGAAFAASKVTGS